jgi:hypothetical protein
MRSTPSYAPGFPPQGVEQISGPLPGEKRTTPATALAEYATASPALLCPCCRGHLIRTWRRPGDRVLNFFVALHRYRCQAHHCRWEGNIRRARASPSAAHGDHDPLDQTPGRTVPVTFVACMLLSLAAAAVVFVAAQPDWMPSMLMAISDAGSKTASASAAITPVASKGP